MKFMAKINRGAILTAVVLIAVIIYLIVLSAIRNAELPDIRTVVTDYINVEIRYSMLPEQYRLTEPKMPEAAKEQFLAEMNSALGVFYVKDEKIRKFNLDRQKVGLESQMRGVAVVYDYQKTIQKFDSFDFNQDVVTVKVTVQSVYDGPGSNNPGGSTGRQKLIQVTNDTVVLQKEDDEWRVVYANLQRPGSGYGMYSGQEMYK